VNWGWSVVGTKAGVVRLIVGEERRVEEWLSGASWCLECSHGIGERGGEEGREKTNKGTGEHGSYKDGALFPSRSHRGL
jgi:hypothetical protein